MLLARAIGVCAEPFAGSPAASRLELPGRLDGHRQLEDRRPVGGERAGERGTKPVHAGDALPARTERTGEGREVGVDQGRFGPTALEERTLEALDGDVAAVVHHR